MFPLPAEGDIGRRSVTPELGNSDRALSGLYLVRMEEMNWKRGGLPGGEGNEI